MPDGTAAVRTAVRAHLDLGEHGRPKVVEEGRRVSDSLFPACGGGGVGPFARCVSRHGGSPCGCGLGRQSRAHWTVRHENLRFWQTDRMYPVTEDVLGAVGPRLRARGRQRAITLAELGGDRRVGEHPVPLGERATPGTLELLLPRPAPTTCRWTIGGRAAQGDPRIHLKTDHRSGMVFVPLSRRPGGAGLQDDDPGAAVDAVPAPKRHEGFECALRPRRSLRLVVGDGT